MGRYSIAWLSEDPRIARGRLTVTSYLTTENLLVLAEELGGLRVRDLGLLDSAAHRPAATVFGEEAYPDVHTKAAALLESITRNHPLVDGDKRLAWVAVVVFYGINDLALRAPQDPAFELVTGGAEGRLPYPEVAARLAGWVTPVR